MILSPAAMRHHLRGDGGALPHGAKAEAGAAGVTDQEHLLKVNGLIDLAWRPIRFVVAGWLATKTAAGSLDNGVGPDAVLLGANPIDRGFIGGWSELMETGGVGRQTLHLARKKTGRGFGVIPGLRHIQVK